MSQLFENGILYDLFSSKFIRSMITYERYRGLQIGKTKKLQV